MVVGDICLGIESGSPVVFLVIGKEDDQHVCVILRKIYDVYVGDCFGTPMGIDNFDPEDPALITDLESDLLPTDGICNIGKDKLLDILHQAGLPDGTYEI